MDTTVLTVDFYQPSVFNFNLQEAELELKDGKIGFMDT